jgi:hypothetical protein
MGVLSIWSSGVPDSKKLYFDCPKHDNVTFYVPTAKASFVRYPILGVFGIFRVDFNVGTLSLSVDPP